MQTHSSRSVGSSPLTKKVPFLDLRVSDEGARQRLLGAVDRVLRHGRLILGPEVVEIEKRVASLCDRRYAVGVNSGTDALFLALKSLDVGPGDEVITTSLSWVATANAIALTKATPVFADIGDDLNIHPDSVRRLVTSKTKAVVPVDYTGKVCQMGPLRAIAQEHGIKIVEDAAQAFGATHHGRPAGSFGELASFSMNPMKVFAACGEAGMIVTDDPGLSERLIILRYNGTVNKEVCNEPSLNARLDTIQAAMLLERLSEVEEIIHLRRQIAEQYSKGLAGVVTVPHERAGDRDVYYTYTIQTDARDGLKTYLEEHGIETKIQHPFLMPDQPAFLENVSGEFTNARRIVKRILCLPIHEKLDTEDVDYVIGCVRDFVARL